MRRTRNHRPTRKKKKLRCYGHREKKEMHARVSRSIEEMSRIYQEEANLDGSRICQGSIGQTKSFSMDREAVEKVQDDHYKWLN